MSIHRMLVFFNRKAIRPKFRRQSTQFGRDRHNIGIERVHRLDLRINSYVEGFHMENSTAKRRTKCFEISFAIICFDRLNPSDEKPDVLVAKIPDKPVEHFQVKTTEFLRQLSSRSPAVKAIYTYDPLTENMPVNRDRDILHEKRNSPVKGTVYKFAGRIVVLLSYTCAANCRYCERQDRVGAGLDSQGYLRQDEIERIVSFVQSRAEINEVILSGGDPLMNPRGLKLIAHLLSGMEQVRILRIHTRVPVQQPSLVDLELLKEISEKFKTCYFSVHIDHADELTPETEDILLKIRRAGYIMLAQTVFLKGINDDSAALRALFVRLSELGVRPYYIYHCQAIPTTMKFVMRIEDEIAIMTQLREEVSGVAYPQHVIDIQHAKGKILVPTNHWKVDLTKVKDFDENWLAVEERVMQSLES